MLETASGRCTTNLHFLSVHGKEFESINRSSSEPHTHTEMKTTVWENSGNELQQDSDDSDKDQLEYLQVSRSKLALPELATSIEETRI